MGGLQHFLSLLHLHIIVHEVLLERHWHFIVEQDLLVKQEHFTKSKMFASAIDVLSGSEKGIIFPDQLFAIQMRLGPL